MCWQIWSSQQPAESGHQLQDGAVLVIAQKVVSKAEGRLVHLQDVIVTAEARTLSQSDAKRPSACHLDSAGVTRRDSHAAGLNH